MPQVPVLQAAGLYTSPNPYSSVPPGALTTADNVIIRTPGVIEPRPGFGVPGHDAHLSASAVSAGTDFNDGVISWSGATGTLYHSTDDSNVDYSAYSGTYAAVDSTLARIRFVEAQQNLYLNASANTYCITSLSSTPVVAGTPRCLDGLGATTTASATTSANWLPDTYSVAYRWVFSRIDSHGAVKRGAPSGRIVVTNSAGSARPVLLTMYVPYEIASNASAFYYEIYRSLVAPSGESPDDELFLVRNGSCSELSSNTIQVTDYTPEAVLGQSLYTNPKTGNGIGDANFRPPIAKDLAFWQNSLWFANTRQPQRLDYRLLGVGTPDGIQAADRFVIGERIFIANVGADFAIETSGDVAYNVEQTAHNIIKANNKMAFLPFVANTGDVTPYHAFYTSGDSDDPGNMLWEEVTPSTTAFYAAASRPASFFPQPPTAFTLSSLARTTNVVSVQTASNHGYTTGDTVILAAAFHSTSGADISNFPTGSKTITVTGLDTFTYAETAANAASALPSKFSVYKPLETLKSSNDTALNKLFYSKFEEPEAVPLLNYLAVGAKNKEIKRIFPLRDRLYVFKEDGLFIISGQAPYFRVDLLDSTAQLISADSVVGLNNQIFALTDQGVATVSEGGVGVVSTAIADVFRDVAIIFGTARYMIWAAPHDREDSYYIGIPQSHSSTKCKWIYVYNVFTKAWTRWTIETTGGYYSPDEFGGLRLADPSSLQWLYPISSSTAQRNYDISAIDVTNILTITSQSATDAVLILQNASGLVVGDAVDCGVDYALITAINGATITVKKSGSDSFVLGGIGLYRGYTSTVEYAPQGDPGGLKQFKEAKLHFMPSATLRKVTATFRSNGSTSSTTVDATNAGFDFTAADSLTGFVIPSEPWDPRFLVPIEKQRGTFCRFGMSVYQAFGTWKLHGFTPDYESLSQRTSR